MICIFRLVVRSVATVIALLVVAAALAAPTLAASTLEKNGDVPLRSRPVVRQTPEIDPMLTRSLATILIGGLLILRDRRRR